MISTNNFNVVQPVVVQASKITN